MYNTAKELYCDANVFVFLFFIVYMPKKNRNWKMAQGCRLSPTIYRGKSVAVRFKTQPQKKGNIFSESSEVGVKIWNNQM